MPIDKIEALVDSLAALSGASTNPDSHAYQTRNPIGLLNFGKPGKNEIDENGKRIFSTWLAGYRAATFDLTKKISGESRSGVKRDDKLANLLRVLGVTEKLGQTQIVRFLRRALKDESISIDTPLAFFRQETK
jgi:hypothetical protein